MNGINFFYKNVLPFQFVSGRPKAFVKRFYAKAFI